MRKTIFDSDVQDDPEETQVRIDIERMERALASPEVLMPSGLSREEMIEFITAHSKSAEKD